VLAALLVSLLVLSLERGEPARAIVGGHEVPPGNSDYPFMAHLRIPDANGTTYHGCGGTMLDGNSVLTAAHCFLGVPDGLVSRTEVRVGSTRLYQGVERRALRVWIPEGFDLNQDPEIGTDMRYDVAVVTLSEPAIPCDQNGCGGMTTALANPNQDFFEEPGTIATAVGWGCTKRAEPKNCKASPVLREVEIEIHSDQDAESVWGQHYTAPLMVAAGNQGRGANVGDSGGPLLVRAGPDANGRFRYFQIGIASFIDNNLVRRATCDYTNWLRCYDVFTEVNNPSIINFIRWASIR
jgi:trypsin